MTPWPAARSRHLQLHREDSILARQRPRRPGRIADAPEVHLEDAHGGFARRDTVTDFVPHAVFDDEGISFLA